MRPSEKPGPANGDSKGGGNGSCSVSGGANEASVAAAARPGESSGPEGNSDDAEAEAAGDAGSSAGKAGMVLSAFVSLKERENGSLDDRRTVEVMDGEAVDAANAEEWATATAAAARFSISPRSVTREPRRWSSVFASALLASVPSLVLSSSMATKPAVVRCVCASPGALSSQWESVLFPVSRCSSAKSAG